MAELRPLGLPAGPQATRSRFSWMWTAQRAGHCVLSRQGDLKGYLRSCRVTESMAPDPLTLQRMACEVACGVLHLHRHNYVHR